MKGKIIFILIFAAGAVIGSGGFYLFQADGSLTLAEAGRVGIDFINRAIEKDNVTASLTGVTEESGVYKINLKIADSEYDSFITRDGRYLFSSAYDLSQEDIDEQGQQSQQSNQPAVSLDDFADCLAESGAKFYGAFWCGHCKNQKEMFGQAAELLPYVECSLPDGQGQTDVCVENDIASYPTWVFADGTKQPGELSLQTLAEKTGCQLPQ